MLTNFWKFVCVALALALWPDAISRVAAQATAVVTVTPTTNQVPVTGARQLSAAVTGAASTAVTWSVNGIIGGNSTLGTVTGSGYYAAPAAPPPGYLVTITATSVAVPAAGASCAMTVCNLVPKPLTVSPNPVPAGAFTLTITGNNFISASEWFMP